MARLIPAGREDREDATAFTGRVARWDSAGPIRLRADGELVRMWATTPFDTLVTRAVRGTVQPSDVTVHAGNLLAALAVARDDEVDPGPAIDAAWRSQLPPPQGWVTVDAVPATVLAGLAEEGATGARDRPGPSGAASTALLDTEVLTVSGAGMRVVINLRMVFALSGMGFAPALPGEEVRVSATDAWVRIDARYGAVVRRRHALLPLLV
ncbi:hypothetical protein [Nakamurella multipartita]|uniref:Uncharacterized protein n=1 Tax=Nakamurella multipartita (strain ATCC 700099 / DSM 44233 / CIP 104796 / JCM 9543 / NBRC 105858 / Y-104) TaxID=479431 RepID=C8XGM8_NAKMY|nr:hypothetical protein [Nakamurella multipartita]ACV78211.1 hypothetical protein Namu_1821 [Nakamurella multipartita DSM 44233]